MTASAAESSRDPVAVAPADAQREAVLAFCRTPFAIRRNVVKVWRPLPAGLWTALDRAEDALPAARRELGSLAAVLAISLGLWLLSSVAYRPAETAETVYPVLGRPVPPATSAITPAGPSVGWGWTPGLSGILVFWTVAPTLAGWAAFRGLWIPRFGGEPARRFAGHLACVYAYVFVMIAVGAVLLALLVRWWPAETAWLRWCLWCFLFGESFFVPAVMWIRLMVHDRDGRAFGPRRYVGLAVYLVVCVVVPLAGMVVQLGRLP